MKNNGNDSRKQHHKHQHIVTAFCLLPRQDCEKQDNCKAKKRIVDPVLNLWKINKHIAEHANKAFSVHPQPFKTLETQKLCS